MPPWTSTACHVFHARQPPASPLTTPLPDAHLSFNNFNDHGLHGLNAWISVFCKKSAEVIKKVSVSRFLVSKCRYL